MSTATAERKPVAEPKRGEGMSWSFLVGIAVVLLATGYVVTSAMGSTVHYYDVDQAVSNPALVGESMRLRGEVVSGSHRVRAGTLDEHLFILSLNQQQVTVMYTGALPDQFRDGASVIATGELVDGETFEADSITAQCPSRYEGEAPTAAAEPMGGLPERSAAPTAQPGTVGSPYLHGAAVETSGP